jgi:E3 ubiquitin-protein ligase UBR7
VSATLPTTESQQDDDDAASETSDSGLPPPLISGDDYESFICGSCVSKIDTLRRWAGTKGIMMVVRDNASAPWKILDNSRDDEEDVDLVEETTCTAAGTKRPLALSAVDVPEAKRPRSCAETSTSCLSPHPNVVAQNILARCSSVDKDSSLGTGDVFLTGGWRERWCRCKSVSSDPCLFICFI